MISKLSIDDESRNWLISELCCWMLSFERHSEGFILFKNPFTTIQPPYSQVVTRRDLMTKQYFDDNWAKSEYRTPRYGGSKTNGLKNWLRSGTERSKVRIPGEISRISGSPLSWGGPPRRLQGLLVYTCQIEHVYSHVVYEDCFFPVQRQGNCCWMIIKIAYIHVFHVRASSYKRCQQMITQWKLAQSAPHQTYAFAGSIFFLSVWSDSGEHQFIHAGALRGSSNRV